MELNVPNKSLGLSPFCQCSSAWSYIEQIIAIYSQTEAINLCNFSGNKIVDYYALLCMFQSVGLFFAVYCDVYNNIDEAAGIIWKVEQQLWNTSLVQKDVKTFAALHQTLLDMSALEGLCLGTFVLSIITVDQHDVVVFFESGIYIGIMHNVCIHVLQRAGLVADNPFLYRVYTPSDVELHSINLQRRSANISEMFYSRTERTVPPKRKNRTAETYSDKLNQLRTVVGNIATILASPESDTCKSFLVHVLKNTAKSDVADHM